MEGKDWGPKPFRFNNCWLKHNEFAKFVTKEWSKWKVKGIGDFCLYEKLKNLKVRLKVWNKEIFGWIDLKVDECIEDQFILD